MSRTLAFVVVMMVSSIANAQMFKHKSKTVVNYPPPPTIAVMIPVGTPPPPSVYIVPSAPTCGTAAPTCGTQVKVKRKIKFRFMRGC